MVGGFQFAIRAVCGMGLVVETAVGQRPTEALVEEQEQQYDLDTFGGELVGVAGAIALEQPVAFQFSQVVAKLIQAVEFG